MPIVIREYRDEDWPQVASIWSVAFFGGEPVGQSHRVLRHEGAVFRVAEDEEGIVGALSLIPMRVSCRGSELEAGGVAAVAVAPEHRQQGVGSSLMHESIVNMRRRGMILSVLHASRAGFYRELGYAHAGARMELTCPTAKLPRMREDLPLQRLTPDDWGELAPAYAAFARRHCGMIARQDARDSLALTLHGADAPLVAYAVGQPVEAYALLRLERLSSDMATTQRVAEMAWATPRGWRAMIEALGMIAANADALDWHEPAGGPGLALHAERKMTVQGWLPPMYRVLDVPAALRALEPDPAVAGAFTLTIEDDVLGENIGPWRVAFAGGKVAVESAGTEAGADLTMPIGAFTQALLGQPDLAALEAAGAVVVANPTAYAAARRLLPAHSTYCIDFF